MDVDKYIASGILELYVAGALSDQENLEIATYAKKYTEISAEIISIETAILESDGYKFKHKTILVYNTQEYVKRTQRDESGTFN